MSCANLVAARWRYYLRSIPTLLAGVENWPALGKLAVGRAPQTIWLRQPRLGFTVRSLMDAWIVKETCLDREYERHSVPIEDGWNVVDVGAGIGDFALLAAMAGPRVQVHAYEPFGPSFELLERNLQLNRVSNVKPRQLAVGGLPGSAQLSVSMREAVQHSTARSSLGAQTVAVQSTTLEAIVEEMGACDYLKIDCEGCEYELLFSTPERSLRRISRICLEYHDNVTRHSHQDLVDFLASHGFAAGRYPSRVQPHIGLIYACLTS